MKRNFLGEPDNAPLTGVAPGGKTVKIFRVTSETEGETKKEPGKISTDIHRVTSYFAAHTIERVWKALEPKRKCGEVIVEISEAAPAITILTDNEVHDQVILPCPFCGSEAKFIGINVICCTSVVECGAEIDVGDCGARTAEFALKAWNRRSNC